MLQLLWLAAGEAAVGLEMLRPLAAVGGAEAEQQARLAVAAVGAVDRPASGSTSQTCNVHTCLSPRPHLSQPNPSRPGTYFEGIQNQMCKY